MPSPSRNSIWSPDARYEVRAPETGDAAVAQAQDVYASIITWMVNELAVDLSGYATVPEAGAFASSAEATSAVNVTSLVDGALTQFDLAPADANDAPVMAALTDAANEAVAKWAAQFDLAQATQGPPPDMPADGGGAPVVEVPVPIATPVTVPPLMPQVGMMSARTGDVYLPNPGPPAFGGALNSYARNHPGISPEELARAVLSAAGYDFDSLVANDQTVMLAIAQDSLGYINRTANFDPAPAMASRARSRYRQAPGEIEPAVATFIAGLDPTLTAADAATQVAAFVAAQYPGSAVTADQVSAWVTQYYVIARSARPHMQRRDAAAAQATMQSIFRAWPSGIPTAGQLIDAYKMSPDSGANDITDADLMVLAMNIVANATGAPVHMFGYEAPQGGTRMGNQGTRDWAPANYPTNGPGYYTEYGNGYCGKVIPVANGGGYQWQLAVVGSGSVLNTGFATDPQAAMDQTDEAWRTATEAYIATDPNYPRTARSQYGSGRRQLMSGSADDQQRVRDWMVANYDRIVAAIPGTQYQSVTDALAQEAILSIGLNMLNDIDWVMSIAISVAGSRTPRGGRRDLGYGDTTDAVNALMAYANSLPDIPKKFAIYIARKQFLFGPGYDPSGVEWFPINQMEQGNQGGADIMAAVQGIAAQYLRTARPARTGRGQGRGTRQADTASAVAAIQAWMVAQWQQHPDATPYGMIAAAAQNFGVDDPTYAYLLGGDGTAFWDYALQARMQALGRSAPAQRGRRDATFVDSSLINEMRALIQTPGYEYPNNWSPDTLARAIAYQMGWGDQYQTDTSLQSHLFTLASQAISQFYTGASTAPRGGRRGAFAGVDLGQWASLEDYLTTYAPAAESANQLAMQVMFTFGSIPQDAYPQVLALAQQIYDASRGAPPIGALQAPRGGRRSYASIDAAKADIYGFWQGFLVSFEQNAGGSGIEIHPADMVDAARARARTDLLALGVDDSMLMAWAVDALSTWRLSNPPPSGAYNAPARRRMPMTSFTGRRVYDSPTQENVQWFLDGLAKTDTNWETYDYDEITDLVISGLNYDPAAKPAVFAMVKSYMDVPGGIGAYSAPRGGQRGVGVRWAQSGGAGYYQDYGDGYTGSVTPAAPQFGWAYGQYSWQLTSGYTVVASSSGENYYSLADAEAQCDAAHAALGSATLSAPRGYTRDGLGFSMTSPTPDQRDQYMQMLSGYIAQHASDYDNAHDLAFAASMAYGGSLKLSMAAISGDDVMGLVNSLTSLRRAPMGGRRDIPSRYGDLEMAVFNEMKTLFLSNAVATTDPSVPGGISYILPASAVDFIVGQAVNIYGADGCTPDYARAELQTLLSEYPSYQVRLPNGTGGQLRSLTNGRLRRDVAGGGGGAATGSTDTSAQPAAAPATPATTTDPTQIVGDLAAATAQSVAAEIQALNDQINAQQQKIDAINADIASLQAQAPADGTAPAASAAPGASATAPDGTAPATDASGNPVAAPAPAAAAPGDPLATAQQELAAEQAVMQSLTDQLNAKMDQLKALNDAATAAGTQPAAVPAVGNAAAAADQTAAGTTQGANRALASMRLLMDRYVAPVVRTQRLVERAQWRARQRFGAVRAVTQPDVQKVLDSLDALKTAMTDLYNNADPAPADQTNNQGPTDNTQTQNPPAGGQNMFRPRVASLDWGMAQAGRTYNSAFPEPMIPPELQRQADAGRAFHARLVEACVAARVRLLGSDPEDAQKYRARIAGWAIEELDSELTALGNPQNSPFVSGRMIAPRPLDPLSSGSPEKSPEDDDDEGHTNEFAPAGDVPTSGSIGGRSTNGHVKRARMSASGGSGDALFGEMRTIQRNHEI